MFYIEKPWRNHKNNLSRTHVGPSIIVFLAFLGLTLWSAHTARNTIIDTRTKLLHQHLDDTESSINARLATYENVLRAGVGLFGGSSNVTRSEWTAFMKVFDLQTRYPGVQSVGYMSALQPSQIVTHTTKVQADDWPTYTIFPAGERSVYTPVDYIEPMTQINSKAIGYDMYYEANRRNALELARDSGEATVTSVVTLIQDTNDKQRPGFLMFAPVYATGSPIDTETQRKASLIGYIFAQFHSIDLLRETLPETEPNFGFQIRSGNTPASSLLYENSAYNRVSQLPKKQALFQTFRVNNQTWSINGVVDPDIIPITEQRRSGSVLWGGILFSIFVAVFIYLLLLNRTRRLIEREERDVQAAKDELLALASHQLRTPATGVKQYIGLLRDGYAGKLTREQKAYVNKAYASNERQLSTINEMLVVARADAGDIKLVYERFNICDLLNEILDEHAAAIKERRQKLRIKTPSKRFVYGDPRYLRMGIENIVSNSVKYTPNNGSLDIKLVEYKRGMKLSIQDTGVGVSKTDLPLLYKKFSRIPNNLTRKVAGSGIGLYLAKKIFEAHLGSIEFTSEEGVGSCCTLILPPERKRPK